MSLIQCNSACVHQNDGYCMLEHAAEVTNGLQEGGCVHFVPLKPPCARTPRRTKPAKP